eukprot:127438-Lingulodinium_polyedra.AAC.1
MTIYRCDKEEVDRRQLSGVVAIETDYQRGLEHRAEMFASMNVPLDATITRSPRVASLILG